MTTPITPPIWSAFIRQIFNDVPTSTNIALGRDNKLTRALNWSIIASAGGNLDKDHHWHDCGWHIEVFAAGATVLPPSAVAAAIATAVIKVANAVAAAPHKSRQTLARVYASYACRIADDVTKSIAAAL